MQRRIQDCCNIQGGTLCDNIYRLEAVKYYHKDSTLDVAAVLDPPLMWIKTWLIVKHLTNGCYRSSHSEVFLGKGVLLICSKFTGEPPCRSAISIKLQSNFIEITYWHGCSPVNLLHIFRTPFSYYWNHTLAWVFSCEFAAYFQNNFFLLLKSHFGMGVLL